MTVNQTDGKWIVNFADVLRWQRLERCHQRTATTAHETFDQITVPVTPQHTQYAHGCKTEQEQQSATHVNSAFYVSGAITPSTS